METPNELIHMIKEIAGSDRELHGMLRKATAYFQAGDKDYENLSLYVQGIYVENESTEKERTDALCEFLQDFLMKKGYSDKIQSTHIPPYIQDIVIQTSYWKPYLILFKCRYGDKKAFGKLFILDSPEVEEKYRTERDINTTIVEPLLAHTQNIPRLLHVDETVDGRAFYEAVKSHLLDKHRKYLEMTFTKAAPNAHLLLYEDVGDHPLKTYLNKLTDMDLQKALFQLFATTHLLHVNGICHGDLFARTNIMLRELDAPEGSRTLSYTIEGKKYTIPNIRWLLTIIDFDLAGGHTSACDDYTVVTESIQEARKIPIPFPPSLVEAIDVFGKPYLVSMGGKRTTRGQKIYRTR